MSYDQERSHSKDIADHSQELENAKLAKHTQAGVVHQESQTLTELLEVEEIIKSDRTSLLHHVYDLFDTVPDIVTSITSYGNLDG